MATTQTKGTIIFLYGSDTASSKLKLDAIRQKFIDRYGETDVEIIDGETLSSPARLIELIETRPFFGEKRMIIIKNILQAKSISLKNEIASNLIRYKESPAVVVFYETKDFSPKSKPHRLFSALAKEPYAQDFAPPTPINLSRKLKAAFEARSIQAEPAALALMSQELAADPARVPNEIEKLAMYKADDNTPLSIDDVQLLVRPHLATNIFALIDAVGAKNQPAIIKEFTKLKDADEGGLRLLGMIISHARNLLVIKDSLERGIKLEEISRRLKIHPFVAKKTAAQANNFNLTELKKFFHALKELDVAFKTGGVSSIDGGLLDLLVETAIK